MESRFKGKTSKVAKKQIKEFRETAAWLNRDIEYKPSRYLAGESKETCNKLFDSIFENIGLKEDQKRTEFEILLANLLSVQKKNPISISRNKNDWKLTKYSNVTYFTIKTVDILLKHKLIKMEKGYNIGEKRMTRIWGSQKLFDHFPHKHIDIRYKPFQLVEVRDDKKKLIDFRDTAEVYRIRKILRKANEINNKADITYISENIEKRLNTALVAIFYKKLTLGGRLYTRGLSHYQGLKSEKRNEVLINGKPSIELDFKALHPTLLYASEGIQYRRDPYTVINDNPIARPFLKNILICMINAEDFTLAEGASNEWLYKNHTDREALKKIGITRARPLMEVFFKVHEEISHYFCNSKESGLRIVNKDSKIALDVINHFVKQDIPILCIHDSFIVDQKYGSELKETMQKTYKKHTRGFRIIVK